MITKVQKWGNSQGLRLSKELLSNVQIDVGDAVDVSVHAIEMVYILQGAFYVLDLDSGRLVSRRVLERGIRYMAFAKNLHKLVAANYIGGSVYLFDANTNEREAIARCGRRLRSLIYKDGRVYFTSWGGAFQLDLRSFEKPHAVEPKH